MGKELVPSTSSGVNDSKSNSLAGFEELQAAIDMPEQASESTPLTTFGHHLGTTVEANGMLFDNSDVAESRINFADSPE